MRTLSAVILLFVVGSLLCGCSSEPSTTVSNKRHAIDHVNAPFSQSAITLNVTSEPGLNIWNEIANSCTLLVIQAQKDSSLKKVLTNPALLKSLFHGAGAEEDILKVDRYTMMPGQHITLHIDRSENARNVAIVAGYYPFPKKQHMAQVNIPVALNSSGWWTKKWTAQLSPLILDITLGSQSITQLTKHSSHEDVQSPESYLVVQNTSDNKQQQGEK